MDGMRYLSLCSKLMVRVRGILRSGLTSLPPMPYGKHDLLQ
jgi:hypothetical protein